MSQPHWPLLDIVSDAPLIPETDKAAGKRSNALAELGKSVEKELDLPWSKAWSRLGDGLVKLTDIPLDEVLLSAWTRYAELVELAGKSRAEPDKTFEQEIARQRIQSVHRPYVEILVDGRPWRKLELKITLQLDLQAFNVQLRDGLVQAVTPGVLNGSVSVAYGPEELGRSSFGPARLPGTLAFDPGIPLGITRQTAPAPTQSAETPTTIELRAAPESDHSEATPKRRKPRRRLRRFLFFSGLVLLAFWLGMPWLEQQIPGVVHDLRRFVADLLR